MKEKSNQKASQNSLNKIKKQLPNHLEIIDVSKWSHEKWLSYRLIEGVGASEVGTLLGLNPYMCTGELYYQKLGLINQKIDDNPSMLWGKVHESSVAEMSKYWDFNEEDGNYLMNHEQKNIQREIYEAKVYCKNPEIEYLFGGPDRFIQLENKLGILEIKTIRSIASDQWENGIPPSYIAQVLSYMKLFDTDYGEIASLKDGWDFEIIQVPWSEKFIKKIQDQILFFWENVLIGRNILESNGTLEQIHEIDALFYEETSAYEEFQKIKFSKTEENSILSNDNIDEVLIDFLDIKSKLRELDKAQTSCEIKIKEHMKHMEYLDSTIANVSWKKMKNGNRRFLCKPK